MSSSASDSESSYDSDEAKTRDYSGNPTNSASVSSDEEGALCADDPVADAEWFAQYEQKMHEIRAHEKRMKDRLDGIIELREWSRLQSMAVFVKILGAPKTRIWVRVRKNGQVRQEKFSRCAKIYLSVPKYLRTALYFKAWL